jgi:hypothetical protein
VGEYTYLYTIRGMKSLVYAITNACNKNGGCISHFHIDYSLNTQCSVLFIILFIACNFSSILRCGVVKLSVTLEVTL